MKKFILSFAGFALTALLSGCVNSYNIQVELDPAEPLRVAVLPFYQVDSNGQIENSYVRLFQTKEFNAQFEKQDELPAEYVQQQVLLELEKTNFDIVPPTLVRADLVHHGFVKDEGFDYKRIDQTSAAELCKVLACDAVFRGKVTEWDQSYYVAQSVSTVRLDLKLQSAKGGKDLFTALAADSSSQGLTKGPTGYTSVVLAPLQGLRDHVIEALAAETVEKALKPIHDIGAKRKLETPAPVIIATSHTAPAGSFDRKKTPFLVLATGSAGAKASFSIGKDITAIPMDEVEPMHYVGEYYPLKSDTFSGKPVVVSFRDNLGRETLETVAVSSVSLR